MKKYFSLALIVLLLVAVSVGCATGTSVQNTTAAPTATSTEAPTEAIDENAFEDGVYFSTQEEFSKTGWKYHVTITVEDGKIVDAVWNATNRVPGLDKMTVSEQGNYGMVAFGKAQAEWHEQAQATIAYFLETQSYEVVEGFYPKGDGKTDTIAGVSITVSEFFELAKEALESEPVAAGSFTDGYHVSVLDPDDKGWQYMAQFIVVNGTIVDVNYNSQSITQLDDAGKPVDKKGLGFDYGMKEKAKAAFEWFEYAEMIENYIVETQGFDVNYTSDKGNTDTIASVTIGVKEIDLLFDKAFN
jgi:major membrane immunogen (membrane-anchored lipoprotein)